MNLVIVSVVVSLSPPQLTHNRSAALKGAAMELLKYLFKEYTVEISLACLSVFGWLVGMFIMLVSIIGMFFCNVQ